MTIKYKTFCLRSRKLKDYEGITQSWEWARYRKNLLLISFNTDNHEYLHKQVMRAVKCEWAYKGAKWKILEGDEIPPEVQAYLLLIP